MTQCTVNFYPFLYFGDNLQYAKGCILKNCFVIEVAYAPNSGGKSAWGHSINIWFEHILPYMNAHNLKHYKCDMLLVSKNTELNLTDPCLIEAYHEIKRGDLDVSGLEAFPEFKAITNRAFISPFEYVIEQMQYWKLQLLNGMEQSHLEALLKEEKFIDKMDKLLNAFFKKHFKTSTTFGCFIYGNEFKFGPVDKYFDFDRLRLLV